MTQIVYDGKALIVDRKVHVANAENISYIRKLQIEEIGDIVYAWAFCGMLQEVYEGNNAVRAMLGVEHRVERSLLTDGAKTDGWSGVLVEVPRSKPSAHKVYYVNYEGQKLELMQGQLVCEGAYHHAMDVAIRTNIQCGSPLTTEQCIRLAVSKTHHAQWGEILDKFVIAECEGVIC